MYLNFDINIYFVDVATNLNIFTYSVFDNNYSIRINFSYIYIYVYIHDCLFS